MTLVSELHLHSRILKVRLIISADKGPILLTDHYHREYLKLVKDVVSTDVTKIVSPTI